MDNNKETLEEAKQRILEANYMSANDADIFELGVKWQAERMYSEEEVWKLINKLNETLNIGSDLTLEEWFEKFKKK